MNEIQKDDGESTVNGWGTFSGHFDPSPEFAQVLYGSMAPNLTRSIKIMPSGARYPWSKVCDGEILIDSTTERELPEGTAFDINYHFVSPPVWSRLGMRTWYAMQSRTEQTLILLIGCLLFLMVVVQLVIVAGK